MKRSVGAIATRCGLELLLAGMVIALLLYKGTTAPPLWFDEGVNLSLARNWVESGYYALLLNGQPQAPDLVSTGLPAIAPIALSFKLFGVGAWQGRLPGGLFVMGGFILIYGLARWLYGRRVALGSVVVLLLMSQWHMHLSPVLLGREALGEMPSLCYLLVGYGCLGLGWRKWPPALILASLSWGLALQSKPQLQPFFAISFLLPIAILAARHRWARVGVLGASLAGALLTLVLGNHLTALLMSSRWPNGSGSLDLNRGLAAKLDLVFVLDPAARLAVLSASPGSLLAPVAGLLFAGLQIRTSLSHGEDLDSRQIVRMALWGLSLSWLCWWAFLSIGWLRYLFPALFIGSIFVSSLLACLTGGFSVHWITREVTGMLRAGRPRLSGLGIICALVLVGLAVPPTVQMLGDAYNRDPDASLFDVATMLNTQTTADAHIETYESELFFLLNRPYHYPSNTVQDQLNRRAFLKQDVPVDYQLQAANSDYLVIGPMARLWHLYDAALNSGEFRLIRSYTRYDLYSRVKP